MGDLADPMAFLFSNAIGVTLWFFYFLKSMILLFSVKDLGDGERSRGDGNFKKSEE